MQNFSEICSNAKKISRSIFLDFVANQFAAMCIDSKTYTGAPRRDGYHLREMVRAKTREALEFDFSGDVKQFCLYVLSFTIETPQAPYVALAHAKYWFLRRGGVHALQISSQKNFALLLSTVCDALAAYQITDDETGARVDLLLQSDICKRVLIFTDILEIFEAISRNDTAKANLYDVTMLHGGVNSAFLHLWRGDVQGWRDKMLENEKFFFSDEMRKIFREKISKNQKKS